MVAVLVGRVCVRIRLVTLLDDGSGLSSDLSSLGGSDSAGS